MGEWKAAVDAAASMVGWGGSIRMVEAARLAGSIDLITCATRPPRRAELAAGAEIPGGSGVGLCWEDALVSTVGESIDRRREAEVGVRIVRDLREHGSGSRYWLDSDSGTDRGEIWVARRRTSENRSRGAT